MKNRLQGDVRSTRRALFFAATMLSLGTIALSVQETRAQTPLHLKVATEATFAPFTFTDPSGKLQGFDVDVANEICKRINATCEFVVTDFPGMIPALTVGKVDVIISAMVITDARKKTIDFVGPYAHTPNSVVAAKSSPLSKLPHKGEVFNLDTQKEAAQKAIDAIKPMLNKKNMGAQSGTINATFVKDYLGGVVNLTEYKNTQEMDLDLSNGRLDIIINSQIALRKSLSTPPLKDFEFVGPSFMGGVFGGGYGVGLRKGEDQLKAKLETAVRSVVADGTIKRLSEQWLGVDATPKSTAAK